MDAGQPAHFQLTLSGASGEPVTVEVETTPTVSDAYDPADDVLQEEIPAGDLSVDFTIGTQSSFTGSTPVQFTAVIAEAKDATPAPTTATATVIPPPTANNDSYMTLAGVPLTVAALGLLANDTSPDGSTLTVAYTQLPTHGSLNLRTDGSFAFTPAAGYAGTDSFGYEAHGNSGYSAPATVSIGVARPTLSSVRFDASQDHYTLMNDPGAPAIYNSWSPAGGDPLWYKRGATMTVDAVVTLDRPWTGGEIELCATDPTGIISSNPTAAVIPWTVAAVNPPGGYYSTWTAEVRGAVAVQALPNYVADFQMKLNWYATVLGSTVSTCVGTSTNEVYLSYAAPFGASQYNTVVWLGCHNAQCDTVASGVVTDLWNNAFAKNTLQTKEGQALWYYQDWRISDPMTPVTVTNTQALLEMGDGRCGSWASFLVDVLAAQGISASQNDITPTDTRPTPNAISLLLVNFWHFGSPNSSNIVASIPGMSQAETNALLAKYPYVDVLSDTTFGSIYAGLTGYTFSYADVTYAAGTKAKGPNNDPAALFPDHDLVTCTVGGNTYWFDPSYGACDWGSSDPERLQYFDNNSVSGFAVGLTAQVKVNGQTVNRFILLIRKPNTLGGPDLQEP